MSTWLIAIYIFVCLVALSFMPVLLAKLKKINLEDGGASTDKSPHFSPNAKELLDQHHSRMMGTLLFWKKEATFYRRFHYFVLGWLIPLAILIPLLTQALTDDPYSKWFLTIVSTVSAVLLSFHGWLKIEQNYKAFRQGESNYYDLRRKLMDIPTAFGKNETEQLNKYFEEVSIIRKQTRNLEIENFPGSEVLKSR